MVFGERLVARANKGRVFGLGSTPATNPLAFADGQGAYWVGSNVYEVGQTVEARTAAFTGGGETVTYRYRFQTKDFLSDNWVSQSWTNTTNAQNSVFYNITENGQLRFQSQASEFFDTLNSTPAIKTVTETFGTVTATVNGAAYDIAVGTPAVVYKGDTVDLGVAFSGNASSVAYNWTVTVGGSYTVIDGAPNATVYINDDAPFLVHVVCSLVDGANVVDSPYRITYYLQVTAS